MIGIEDDKIYPVFPKKIKSNISSFSNKYLQQNGMLVVKTVKKAWMICKIKGFII